MRKEKGPGACPAFFVGEEKGPPKKAALGWKQNKNSKPFDLLFLVRITIRGLEKPSIYAGCSHWQCCKSDEIVLFDSHIGINPSFPL